MGRSVFLACLLAVSIVMPARQAAPAAGQTAPDSSTSSQRDSRQKAPADSARPTDSKSATKDAPNLTAPRSDRVNAADLGSDVGDSSSKDTQIDLSPPADDAKKHPESSEALMEAGTEAEAGSGVGEFHPWDPHKAAKDVEVGDFYFKRKNYRAAEDRYREALFYKDNDAIAMFRLGVCLEKMDRPDEARTQYENYLKVLPHGPEEEEARKAIERLKGPAAAVKPPK